MPSYKNLSDNELIFLLVESDHAAYTEIYNRYYYLMFLFAYKKLGDEENARDFVQELFSNLWHKRAEISTIGNFAAFLYKSLRNKILDYLLHEKVVSKYFVFLEQYLSNNSHTNSDDLIREKQLAAYIETQIEQLPKKMRAVFIMSRKQYLTHKEIAKTLNTSEDNVAKHVTNALKF